MDKVVLINSVRKENFFVYAHGKSGKLGARQKLADSAIPM